MKQSVMVIDRGELVILKIGLFVREMEFATALELAALMRREARWAKRASGNFSHDYNALAVLHDAAAERHQSRRFSQIVERLKARQFSVTAKGQIVEVRIGRQVIDISFAVATTIAQWLRIRGKLARNAAGEKAHWSKLVTRDSLSVRT